MGRTWLKSRAVSRHGAACTGAPLLLQRHAALPLPKQLLSISTPDIQGGKIAACGVRWAASWHPRLLGALALLQSPGDLDAEGLGKAVTAAAREGIDDDSWWSAILARAKELAPEMGLHTATLIMNGMARSRRLDAKLVEALMPRITAHMIYLTSSQFAMLASAIAKAEVHNAGFVNALTRELKARLLEFQSLMELTMIINAVSKLRVSDEDIYRRLVVQVQNRMGHEALQVRDVSVIVSALARVHCTDAATVGRFADYALQMLPEATPLELARLMDACMRVSWDAHDFFNACVVHLQHQVSSMDPKGLSAAAFAFGQCFEAAEVSHLVYLRRIFRHIRLASVATLPLFLPRELVSLLRTYARWQISFECGGLRRVAERMITLRDQFDTQNAVAALQALAVLMQRSIMRSSTEATREGAVEAASEAAYLLLHPFWRSIHTETADVSLVLRAVEASSILRPHDAAPIEAVTSCLVRQRSDFDGPTCASLYERLLQLGASPDKDVMQVLSRGVSGA